MNISLDQFIIGFERSARELPAVLADWDEIDPELREGYVDQLLWLLRSRQDALAVAMRANRFIEIAQRLAPVVSVLLEVSAGLREKMGIPTDRIVPYTAYSETTSAATAENDDAIAVAV